MSKHNLDLSSGFFPQDRLIVDNNNNNNNNNHYNNNNNINNFQRNLNEYQIDSPISNNNNNNNKRQATSISNERFTTPGIERIRIELLAHKYSFEGKKIKLKSILKKSNLSFLLFLQSNHQ
jgi:hypothetical protein